MAERGRGVRRGVLGFGRLVLRKAVCYYLSFALLV